MSLNDPHPYNSLMVGDLVLLHPAAPAYSTHGRPRVVKVSYQLPRAAYLVLELSDGLMALATESGIVWVSAAYAQEIL